MKWFWGNAFAALIVIALSASVAKADFYKYIDKNGVTRFTDNLADVPPAQRPKVKHYNEETSPQPPGSSAGTGEKKAETVRSSEIQKTESPSPGSKEGSGSAMKMSNPKYYQRLNSEKNLLDSERDQLEQEKEKVEKLRKNANTVATQKQYADEVNKLNKRIKEFNERRDAFKAKVDAFNTYSNSQ